MNSTYNRQEVQECLIVNMAQVLSREEYAKFKSALEEMTDEDFWQFVAEGLATAPKGVGYKEQAKLVNEIRSINGITPKNSAMNDVKLQVVSEEMSRQVWNRIIASRPSDVIKLTGDEDSRLIHLWKRAPKTSLSHLTSFLQVRFRFWIAESLSTKPNAVVTARSCPTE